MIKSNTAWAFTTIGLGAALACLLPWLLTSRSWLGISFLETGPIGDTIGGIAGPVLNFAGLLVIYFSLREQLAANRLQREALEEQKKQINAEQREIQNEKYFELTYKLLEKLSDMAQRNESSIVGMAQHDYWWNYGYNLSNDNKEHEDAGKQWLGYVSKIRDMQNLFNIIINRMGNEILTLNQNELLVSLLELQYISKLDRCRIEYQEVFWNIEEGHPEQLINIDNQRTTLYEYNETLKNKTSTYNTP